MERLVEGEGKLVLVVFYAFVRWRHCIVGNEGGQSPKASRTYNPAQGPGIHRVVWFVCVEERVQTVRSAFGELSDNDVTVRYIHLSSSISISIYVYVYVYILIYRGV